jgi:hypothetical protein
VRLLTHIGCICSVLNSSVPDVFKVEVSFPLRYDTASMGNRFSMFPVNVLVFRGRMSNVFLYMDCLKMRPSVCLEISGTDYPVSRRHITERKNQLHRSVNQNLAPLHLYLTWSSVHYVKRHYVTEQWGINFLQWRPEREADYCYSSLTSICLYGGTGKVTLFDFYEYFTIHWWIFSYYLSDV